MDGKAGSVSKGANFERLCAQALRECGWNVIRAAGSKGPADLWAARVEGCGTPRLLVVQVKSGVNGVGPAAWNELLLLSESTGAMPVIADKLPRIARPQWWRITGPKSGRRGERQPRAPFDIEAWDERIAA